MKLPGRSIQVILVFLIFQFGLFSSWQQLSFLSNSCEDAHDEEKQEHRIDRLKKYPSDPPARHNQPDTTEEEHQFVDGVVARAFPPWPEDLPLPCGEADPLWHTTAVSRSATKEGILFVKEMKTGSSTLSGVVLRIARNIAERRNQNFMCNSRFDHFPATAMEYIDRDPQKSFLFTILRNPQKRITSQFFHFSVSRLKLEPSDTVFQKFVEKSPHLHDYYLKDLGLGSGEAQAHKKIVSKHKPTMLESDRLQELRLKMANGIMQGYDFIGITERMDESLVVLMMILRLKVSDILYIKAKSSGGFDDGAFNQTCIYIVPSFTSPGMKKFFQSPDFFNRTEGDWMLYRAAEKSLDMTIDRLGREQFERHLLEFQAAQKVANNKCSQGIRYPCSVNGVRAPYRRQSDPSTDCLWLDSGCGYECLDRLETEIDSMIEHTAYW